MSFKKVSSILILLLFTNNLHPQDYSPFNWVFLPQKPVYNIFYKNILPLLPQNGHALKKNESFDYRNDAWDKFSETNFEHDARGRIIKASMNYKTLISEISLDNKRILNYRYDKQNRLIERNGKYLTTDWPIWNNSLKYTFEFDNSGNMIFQKTFQQLSENESRMINIRSWNFINNTIFESVQLLNDGEWENGDFNAEYHLNENGDIYKVFNKGNLSGKYEYDKWGNFLGSGHSDGSNDYTYNSKNQIIHRNYNGNISYFYDKYGNLIEIRNNTPSSFSFSNYIFHYNEFGLVKERIRYNWDENLEEKIVGKEVYEYQKIGMSEKQSPLPEQVTVYNNYPNPFNAQTNISFHLKSNSFVKITIYDMLGRKVKILFDGAKNHGYNNVQFNASNLPSGTYFYELKVSPTDNGEIENLMNKMILVK